MMTSNSTPSANSIESLLADSNWIYGKAFSMPEEDLSRALETEKKGENRSDVIEKLERVIRIKGTE